MGSVSGVPSQAKRQAILDAATAAFLRFGYAASVDDIAAAAGVGKQTVYRHFVDKQALFLAALAAAREAGEAHPATAVPDTGDPTGDLTRMGEQILAEALSPTLAALHRLTIAEIGNHPGLSRHWGDTAVPYLDEELTGYLRRCHAGGVLDVPDPARAARQFAYLLITEGRVASVYGTKPLTARRRHTIAAETADLIVRGHRPS
jgi:TetR/AcrR family transcriptional repressor of mexJK operon